MNTSLKLHGTPRLTRGILKAKNAATDDGIFTAF